MSSEISVIICAYTEKRWNELLAAIESVQCQTLSPKEIIVVIDHNPRLLQRLCESVADVIVMENSAAKGASGARNSGAAIARGALLAFLDDDASARPDWLEKLVECYTDQCVVGAGGKIEPRWNEKRPSWFPEEFNWVVGCSYQGLPTETATVRNVIAANMTVRKDILMQVGGFRESFGNNKRANADQARSKWLHHQAGDEETEFCIRVMQQVVGGRWLYTPSAVVQHAVPPERTQWRYFLWRCYDEGLGKAGLARLHTRSRALSSERTYTFKTLPSGIGRGLADALFRSDWNGVTRAGVILVGLTMTTIGYLIGGIISRIMALKSSDQTSAHQLAAEVPIPVKTQR